MSSSEVLRDTNVNRNSSELLCNISFAVWQMVRNFFTDEEDSWRNREECWNYYGHRLWVTENLLKKLRIIREHIHTIRKIQFKIWGANNEESRPGKSNTHKTYWRLEKLRKPMNTLFNVFVRMCVKVRRTMVTGEKILRATKDKTLERAFNIHVLKANKNVVQFDFE